MVYVGSYLVRQLTRFWDTAYHLTGDFSLNNQDCSTSQWQMMRSWANMSCKIRVEALNNQKWSSCSHSPGYIDVRNDSACGSTSAHINRGDATIHETNNNNNNVKRNSSVSVTGIYLEVCYLAANSCPTAQPRFSRFSPFFSNNVGESRYKSVSSSSLRDRRLIIPALPMTRNTSSPLSSSKTCYMCQKVCLSPRRSVPIFRPCPAAAPGGWRHERHSLQQKTNTRRVERQMKRGVCDARRNEHNTCPTCPDGSSGLL